MYIYNAMYITMLYICNMYIYTSLSLCSIQNIKSAEKNINGYIQCICIYMYIIYIHTDIHVFMLYFYVCKGAYFANVYVLVYRVCITLCKCCIFISGVKLVQVTIISEMKVQRA